MICSWCKKNKPSRLFHRLGDGLQRKCKDCMELYAHIRYLKKKKEILSKNKKWREANKDLMAKYVRRDRKKFPNKRAARIAVMNAVRLGKLEKESCYCGVKKVEAHHPSYKKSDFLKVVWLCNKHHKAIHKL